MDCQFNYVINMSLRFASKVYNRQRVALLTERREIMFHSTILHFIYDVFVYFLNLVLIRLHEIVTHKISTYSDVRV